jgi:hypothetical protein
MNDEWIAPNNLMKRILVISAIIVVVVVFLWVKTFHAP